MILDRFLHLFWTGSPNTNDDFSASGGGYAVKEIELVGNKAALGH